MVVGVVLARWSVPALVRGTTQVYADARQAPHLIPWAILAGCLWAVANTLTIFAIRDIGLSIAFPLWNVNSLLGIFWGFVFFHELRQAGSHRWLGVLGAALFMFVGAILLALAASKYFGISRGIPLSNTNQLWGLLWGILVFGELHGHAASLYAQVIGGSLIMAAGAAAIAFSSTSAKEHESWQAAALRESQRYGTDLDYVHAGLEGRNPTHGQTPPTPPYTTPPPPPTPFFA